MSVVNSDGATVAHDYVVVNGDHCKVKGNHCVVNGDYCTVSGNNCVVNGDKCTVSGNNCVVNGDECRITGENCIRPGGGNVVVIRGTNDGNYQVNGGTTTITMGSHGAIRPRAEVLAAVNVTREKKQREDKEEKFVECPTEAQTKEHDKTPPEDDEDAPRCVVCLERAPSCAVVPCMHRCVCCVCARLLAGDGTKVRGTVSCPVCKASVDMIKVLF
jgi:hypothetical protein